MEDKFTDIRITSGNKDLDKVVLPAGTKFVAKAKCSSCNKTFKSETEILSDVYFGDGDDQKKMKSVCPGCGETTLFKIGSRHLKTWFYIGDKFNSIYRKQLTSEEFDFLVCCLVSGEHYDKAVGILKRLKS